MRLTRRDWAACTGIGIILVALFVSTFRERPKNVPADVIHLPFLQAVRVGFGREKVEKECLNCHNPVGVPLSSKHPPKEQCLICHAVQG